MEQSFIEYSLGKDASSAVLWVYPVQEVKPLLCVPVAGSIR